MSKLLKTYYPDAMVHGMRSAFRDWAEIFAEARREVKEAVLAHENPDKVESAYLRTKYYDERETLMKVWSLYLSGEGGTFEDLLNASRLADRSPLASD